jgi:hypothetical protein
MVGAVLMKGCNSKFKTRSKTTCLEFLNFDYYDLFGACVWLVDIFKLLKPQVSDSI